MVAQGLAASSGGELSVEVLRNAAAVLAMCKGSQAEAQVQQLLQAAVDVTQNMRSDAASIAAAPSASAAEEAAESRAAREAARDVAPLAGVAAMTAKRAGGQPSTSGGDAMSDDGDAEYAAAVEAAKWAGPK